MDTSQESLEFENAKLRFEKADLELNGTVLMLNKACSMYNYVKQYGVDKAFVRMHNEHSELDAMTNMSYPGLESFFNYPSDIAKYEQACMEGIMSGIKSAIDWVLKKLQQLGAFIADLVRKFINLFRHTEEDTKKEAALLAGAAENMSPGEEVKVEENSDNIIKTADKLDEKVQDIVDEDKKLQEVKDYIDQLTNEALQRTKENQGALANQGTPTIGYTPDKKAEKTTSNKPSEDPNLYFHDVILPAPDSPTINEIRKICADIAGSLRDLGKGTMTFRNKSDVIKFIDKGKISVAAASRMCDILDKADKEIRKLIDSFTEKVEFYKKNTKYYSRFTIENMTQSIKYMELIARRNMKVRSAIIFSFKSTGYAYNQIRQAIAHKDRVAKRMKIKTGL